MDTRTVTDETQDEFELIELGSASEETRGIPGASDEFGLGSPNSRD